MPERMIADYAAELRKLRCAGILASEVGPHTWYELCCSVTPQQRIGEGETIAMFDLIFMGVRVRKNDTVPEGNFWPLQP